MARAGNFVVALLGVSGSGKSVVARRLYGHHGLTRVRFGDPQRDMIKAGFGLTDAEIDGPSRGRPVDRFGERTPSDLVSTLTHEWGHKAVFNRLWINEWDRRVLAVSGGVLADDMQRPEEADAVRALGGIVVRVTRPGQIVRNTKAAERLLRIRADAEIVNDDIETLSGKADAMIETIKAALARMAA